MLRVVGQGTRGLCRGLEDVIYTELGGFDCAFWRWVFGSVSGNVHVTIQYRRGMLIVLFIARIIV